MDNCITILIALHIGLSSIYLNYYLILFSRYRFIFNHRIGYIMYYIAKLDFSTYSKYLYL